MKKSYSLMIVLGLLPFFFAGGCASFRPLQIEPVAKKKAIVRPQAQSATYRADRDGNLYFILESHTTDKASGQPVDQLLVIRVFWIPVGGKTSLEPSALNSTYRYIVMTPSAVGMYEGAGLTRLYNRVGKRMSARIVDGDLRLSEATESFVDSLGRSRIHGNFKAAFEPASTMDQVLQAQQEFFARSLPGGTVKFDDRGNRINEAPATQAASQPGSQTQAATEPATKP